MKIGKPESARQYETGIRFSFLNERVVPSTAAFNVSRDNVATVVSGCSPMARNWWCSIASSPTASKPRCRPRSPINGKFFANATHQEAVITGAPQAGEHGQRLEHLQIRDQRHLESQVGLGANYRDKTFSDTTNVNSVPAYVTGNAMIGWENANWGVALNVKNFTDQLYFVAANGAGQLVGGTELAAYLAVRYRE